MRTRSSADSSRALRRLAVPGMAATLLALGLASLPAAAAASPATAAAPTTAPAHASGFNQPGNILISDQFNNRVIEINRQHKVVWHFGNGSSVAGPHSVVGVNDVERIGTLTLIAGTGTPPATDPSCTKPNGCADNRVFLVNLAATSSGSTARPA